MLYFSLPFFIIIYFLVLYFNQEKFIFKNGKKLDRNYNFNFENTFEEENIEYKELSVYSSPTRLTLFIKDLAEKIKSEAKEIKGPKVGSPHQVIQGFLRAKNVSENDLIEKETDKGKFYFIKIQSRSISVEDLLIKIIPKAIGSINWKKSMKWSNHNLMWGRPLRAIFARYNNKKLAFNYEHLDATDEVIIEQDLITKTKKINKYLLNFGFKKR